MINSLRVLWGTETIGCVAGIAWDPHLIGSARGGDVCRGIRAMRRFLGRIPSLAIVAFHTRNSFLGDLD